MSVGLNIYIPLSVAMFLEYAVWGAWAPVLAIRLLTTLKMTGKQTGWIYATLPLACIVSPLVAGQLADQWVNAEWILAGAHLIGAVLLLLAANTTTFGRLFTVMLGWSICYAATLPMVNVLLFSKVKDVGTQGMVFIWAPVAWALIGWLLTAWRRTRKAESDGRDGLIFASILSVVMGLSCFALPATPPASTGKIPILEAMQMLRDPSFLIFVVISLAVAGMMQFYFLGTGRFMQDMGIPGKNVPAAMGMAQAAQAVATYFGLSFFLGSMGFKWTLTLGAASWLAMYLIYVASAPRPLIVAAQALHGLAYVMFMIVGQIFAESVAPESIRSSMQALIFTATTGVGLFLGTQLAGWTMDRFSFDGKFQWSKIWMVPAAITLAGAVVLATVFHEPAPAPKAPTPPAPVEVTG